MAIALKNSLIITIDGPAGCGKSTVAVAVAERLGIVHLDTGSMYRAVTLAALERQVPLDDALGLAELAENCAIELTGTGREARVLLDGRDVTEEIRSGQVTSCAHYIAKVAAVREALTTQQRRIAERSGSLVSEGRDQGSVVFPEATFKFYLDATAQCRARRRWQELRAKGDSTSYEEVLAAQKQRDERDRTRQVAPLKSPQGAIIIDTTDMTAEQVVERLCNHIKEDSNR